MSASICCVPLPPSTTRIVTFQLIPEITPQLP